MSKKNKKKGQGWTSAPIDVVSDIAAEVDRIDEEARPEPEYIQPHDSADRLMVSVDNAVHQMLLKTALRNHIGTGVLIDLSIEAMVGSLKNYGYNLSKFDDSTVEPAKGTVVGPVITITPYAHKAIRGIAILFGVRMADVLRDAILGQRYNWQRLQPVNARSMSSIRLQMFELEQLGPRG